jgi:hypothetical protein
LEEEASHAHAPWTHNKNPTPQTSNSPKEKKSIPPYYLKNP